jgi:ribulose-5-phosphate 4-epimerase/fuculose-1-phosphate aldolase
MTEMTAAIDRIQLAACVRLLHMEGLLTYNGHVSVRAPDANGFLIHSLLDSRAEVVPELLLLADLDGRILEPVARRRLPSEFPIHGEIYRARPDVKAVAHIHSESAIAFTLAKGARIQAMRCDGARWAGGVPIHGDPSRIQSSEQGRALAETIGDGDAVLLRAHGAVLAAAGVLELFMTCIHFEENARAQILASRLGELAPLTNEEIATLEASWPESFRKHYAAKIWCYYVTKGVSAGLIPEAWSEKLLS